jgi:hypothetical protein
MNRKFVVLSVIVALALGGACVLLVKQLGVVRQRERTATAAAQAEAASRAAQEERLQDVERERARVEKQNQELASLAANLRQSEAKQASNIAALVERARAASGSETNREAGAEPFGKSMGEMFKKMMEDPAMREMMRNQQKGMLKSMYGALFKELNLPPDQEKQLIALLLDQQMSGVERASGMFGGDAAARTNAIAAITQAHKENSDKIKGLLGEEKFAQYEEYQKSMGDRMVLQQFQQQAAAGDAPLRDEQMQQLVQLMKEERARTPPVISQDPAVAAANFEKMMNDELLNRQLEWQEAFNRRVSERAAGLLTPEQLKEFSDFQAQQVNMQKVGMKMAREMFGTKEGAPSITPVVVPPGQ